MSLPAAPKVPPQVAEQAVRWLVELQGGADDERLRQAWQRWRQAAPEHEQAWRPHAFRNLATPDFLPSPGRL